MNWHEVIDERNLEMDGVVARILESDPARLNRVMDWIDQRLADPGFSTTSKFALKEWRELIGAQGLAGVLEILRSSTEKANRMRQSSPFGVIMPQEERQRILRLYESRRPRTHPAGVS